MSDIDVFISYKREERILADQVSRALKEAGYVAVTDLNIQKATDFGEAIDRMIRKAKVVVVLWTQASAASDWVRKEANEAERQDKYFGIRIEEVTLDDLPFRVRSNNWLDLSDAPFADGLPALVTEVRRLAGQTSRNAAQAESATEIAEKDLEFYQVVSEIGDIGGFKKYVQLYPDGAYVEDARNHIRRRSGLRAALRAVPVFSIITAIGTGVGAYVALSGTFQAPPDQSALTTENAKLRNENAALQDQIDNQASTPGRAETDWNAMETELVDITDRQQEERALRLEAEGTASTLQSQLDALETENSDLRARLAVEERRRQALEQGTTAGRTVTDSERQGNDFLRENALEVQRALADLGFYTGAVDGIWGPNSAAALRKAQEAFGLNPTGDFNDALDLLEVFASMPKPLHCTVQFRTFAVDLRDGASRLNTKIADVPAGRRFPVLDQTSTLGQYWFQIQVGDRVGWVQDFGFIQVSGPDCRR